MIGEAVTVTIVRSPTGYAMYVNNRRIHGSKPCGVGEVVCEANIQNAVTSDRLTTLEEAIRRSGFDVSPCQHCGMPVVCLPDGMPCCEECAGEVGAL